MTLTDMGIRLEALTQQIGRLAADLDLTMRKLAAIADILAGAPAPRLALQHCGRHPPPSALSPALDIEITATLADDGRPLIRLQWPHGDRITGLDLCPALAQTVADQLMQAVQACAAAPKGEQP